ncbi:MAG: aminotransferase class III-fold pyridoxal phosphate-dependent enzyme [Candidatus Heimdallarchaeota archaeon]|nr:aminotransferase class III-fold pyridoxal phosphate-dependent enzyme [Candidatus Heimdallarchaeota archaeon]
MDKEIETYRSRHKKSLELWEQAQERFPGGVSHNIRDFNMPLLGLAPPYIEKAQGSKLFDVDGNIYIDYWMTHYAAILGHAHEAVMKAIADQLTKGNHYGTVNKQELLLADKVIEATPSIEKLRFCTTGTEATMYASRLARAFTEKNLIAKVKGGWHGGNDTIFYSVTNLVNNGGRETNGLRSREEADVVTFDYNDTDGFERLIREHKRDLAAVIMEPVLGAGGGIAPKEGFLETVREETEQNDILLIFDEIITGFRLDYHSGQGYFGVIPDLTTMGKILGGGTPIGLVGGRSDILELANLHKGGRVWIGGGTFSENPVSMVAGAATLTTLEKGGKALYRNLNEKGKSMRKRVRALVEKYNVPAVVTGVGSLIYLHWLKKPILRIETGTELRQNMDKEKVAKFQLLMFNRDIHVRGGMGSISIKHTDEDIERTLVAVEDAIKVMAEES